MAGHAFFARKYPLTIHLGELLPKITIHPFLRHDVGPFLDHYHEMELDGRLPGVDIDILGKAAGLFPNIHQYPEVIGLARFQNPGLGWYLRDGAAAAGMNAIDRDGFGAGIFEGKVNRRGGIPEPGMIGDRLSIPSQRIPGSETRSFFQKGQQKSEQQPCGILFHPLL